MIWDDDIHRKQKYFLLDAIVAFSKEFKGSTFDEISLEKVMDFIDIFVAFNSNESCNSKLHITSIEKGKAHCYE